MRRRRWVELGKHAFIWLVLVFAFFPLYVMLNISFKDNAQFLANPWLPQTPLHPENWALGWQTVRHYIANTIVVAVAATALTLACALGAAYFFARFRLPLARLLWMGLLVLMLMPSIANLIPLFVLLKDLGLLNQLAALVIVWAAGGQVVCVYILRHFIEEIPQDLFDAAAIDGASHWQQVQHIVVPMSGHILSTLAILQFLGAWNDFILPLVVMRDDQMLTLAVGLMRMDSEYVKQYGPMMAGYAIASIPLVLLFIFTMRLFVKGLAEGAIKG